MYLKTGCLTNPMYYVTVFTPFFLAIPPSRVTIALVDVCWRCPEGDVDEEPSELFGCHCVQWCCFC